MSDLYYLFKAGEQSGPLSLGQLSSMWQNGVATADSLFWQEGMAEWQSIQTIAGSLESKPLPPPIVVPPPLPIMAAPVSIEADASLSQERKYKLEISRDGRIDFESTTLGGAKQGLQEFKLQKRNYQAQKKGLQLQMKQIRQNYTEYTRNRGGMVRGGRTIGTVIRIFQSANRDAHRRELALRLQPLEAEINRLDVILLNIEKLTIQVTEKIQSFRV